MIFASMLSSCTVSTRICTADGYIFAASAHPSIRPAKGNWSSLAHLARMSSRSIKPAAPLKVPRKLRRCRAKCESWTPGCPRSPVAVLDGRVRGLAISLRSASGCMPTRGEVVTVLLSFQRQVLHPRAVGSMGRDEIL